ncbi:hypothetical protein BC939DRAFT_335734 [Gamsiella multidivaricata]|uniref:uncharacterized protein n=1 Tax=Gamsiella multidivaricata TaxID=101098 RepID=UPI00221EF331|nr:uncharacterized protein BC939DRAFT_335734 [Gamsiella multidivaricata]KAI7817259.1 hypothetical protein BC939DRAFT_335734 [Gamsiella multidivaricata]
MWRAEPRLAPESELDSFVDRLATICTYSCSSLCVSFVFHPPFCTCCLSCCHFLFLLFFFYSSIFSLLIPSIRPHARLLYNCEMVGHIFNIFIGPWTL